MERTPEQIRLHSQLVSEIIAKRNVSLTEVQRTKLEIGCWKAIDENPELNEHDLLIAVGIYLNFILEFPDLVL
jgi:hypothetical protein